MTEMVHEHSWTDWLSDTRAPRDGIQREWRWCAEWACDSTEIRPVYDLPADLNPPGDLEAEIGQIAQRHILAAVVEAAERPAIEAAAGALFKWDNQGNGLTWEDAHPLTQDRYRVEARRVLAAVAAARPLVELAGLLGPAQVAGSPTAAVEPHTDAQAATREPGHNDT
jgi:hypothetical protein